MVHDSVDESSPPGSDITLISGFWHALKNFAHSLFEIFYGAFYYSPDGDQINAKLVVDKHISKT